MLESLENAKQELRRAEHQIYVSLKYTRTVDVMHNIIERIIATFDYGFEALLQTAKAKKKITSVPTLPRLKMAELQHLYASNPVMMNYLEFYIVLKKIAKARFEASKEFRRHVTMTAHLEEQSIEITIDIITDYFKRVKEFVELVEQETK